METVLDFVVFNHCTSCGTPSVLPSFSPVDRPLKEIALCTCAAQPPSVSFRKTVRSRYKKIDLSETGPTETVVVLGALFGRVQASILRGNWKSLRRNLAELVAVGLRLGEKIDLAREE